MKIKRKKLKQVVARAGNETYRKKKHCRNATHKEKQITEELKRWQTVTSVR